MNNLIEFLNKSAIFYFNIHDIYNKYEFPILFAEIFTIRFTTTMTRPAVAFYRNKYYKTVVINVQDSCGSYEFDPYALYFGLEDVSYNTIASVVNKIDHITYPQYKYDEYMIDDYISLTRLEFFEKYPKLKLILLLLIGSCRNSKLISIKNLINYFARIMNNYTDTHKLQINRIQDFYAFIISELLEYYGIETEVLTAYHPQYGNTTWLTIGENFYMMSYFLNKKSTINNDKDYLLTLCARVTTYMESRETFWNITKEVDTNILDIRNKMLAVYSE